MITRSPFPCSLLAVWGFRLTQGPKACHRGRTTGKKIGCPHRTGRLRDGQARGASTAGRAGHQPVIPSPDLRTITTRRSRKPGNIGRRSDAEVAPPTQCDRDAPRRRDDQQSVSIFGNHQQFLRGRAGTSLHTIS